MIDLAKVFNLLLIISYATSCFNSKGSHRNVEDVLNNLTIMLTRSLDHDKKENYAISTDSIMATITPMLLMLGKTSREKVETCLGKTVKDLQAFMNTQYEDDETFAMATKIWIDNGVKVKENEASETISNMLKRIDIKHGPDEAGKFINSWVSNNTQGMITNLLPKGSLSAETKMVITNALSFRGLWRFPFDEKLTRNRSFHLDENRAIQVPTMAATMETRYYKGKGVGKMIALPYRGEKYCMYVLLPETANTIDKTAISEAMSKMQTLKVKILLPRFRLSSFLNMKGYLSDMGLQPLFNKVDVIENEVYFTDILHKVSVTVDENGTKSAAGTAAITDRMMLPTFRANKPFYFFVANTNTNVIILSGKVSNPMV